jgi:uncharacterized protein (TIGR01777 family)
VVEFVAKFCCAKNISDTEPQKAGNFINCNYVFLLIFLSPSLTWGALISMSSENKVLIVGATGFIGNELGLCLTKEGFGVNILTRDESRVGPLAFPASVFTWTSDGSIPDSAVAGVKAVINLAGESIGRGRWTKKKKTRIIDSRVNAVNAVVHAINKHKVELLVQASAVGIYGDTGTDSVTEHSAGGYGFLAKTAALWESPLKHLQSQTRCVTMRLGVVMGTTGGAFLEMLRPYLSNLGASIGNGRHFFSWIDLSDVSDFVLQAIKNTDYTGIYNLTAPNPATYNELHLSFLKFFGGLSWLRVPACGFKIALGEKSQLLLSSQKVIPHRLEQQGFHFKSPDIKTCLYNLFGSNFFGCGLMHTKQWIHSEIENVWEFFSNERNLETITPPWLNFRVNDINTPKVQDGSEITYSLRIHGIPLVWRSKIRDFQPGRHFRDVQVRGPYKIWNHTHSFSELGGGTLMEDLVRYRLPLGTLGQVAGSYFVQRDVRRIFEYRKRKIYSIFSSVEAKANAEIEI